MSLVPSETETVVMLGSVGRLVGRTDYCVEPRGEIEHVPRVGGTKDARIEDIVALAPDLVLANQEENTPQIVRALEALDWLIVLLQGRALTSSRTKSATMSRTSWASWARPCRPASNPARRTRTASRS